MDRDAPLLELATTHAVALRLIDAEASDEAVAQALGIPVESVPSLVRTAQAKLRALLDAPDLGPRSS